jgi:hypothetical protein
MLIGVICGEISGFYVIFKTDIRVGKAEIHIIVYSKHSGSDFL